MQNGLAGSLQNRGNAKATGGDFTGAIADYDAATTLMESIRQQVGQAAWRSNPLWANTLSAAKANRAMAVTLRASDPII
ncbi:hypothetical protein [Bradyrhizobium sp. 613_E4_N2_2]|uniref:hypothetical protein n=1 Tax=Bradyrhizobium sp. 613_E4_N2_2 TaxID=3240371 RepID=UPI003F89D975